MPEKNTSSRVAKNKAKKKPNAASNRKRNVKKKMHWFPKFLLVLLVLLLAAGGSYVFYIWNAGKTAFNSAYEGERQSDLREEKVQPMTDNISILFVGIDDSEKRSQGESQSRSDALLLATLNNKNKDVKLLSIPRDSYVYIPSFRYHDKITHAHTQGIDSTIDSVESLLNVPVDYYFRLNFDAFIEVVDALGGITVDVPYEINELDENDKRTIHLMPGVQEVNGKEALALARTRKQDNDFKRGERQQMILQAIVKKASKTTSFTKYGDVIEAVGDNMTTNMSFDEMKSLFAYLSDGVPSTESLSLEGYDDMSTGVYYFKLKEESVQSIHEQLADQLGITPSIDADLTTPTDPTSTTDPTDLTNSPNATGTTNSGY